VGFSKDKTKYTKKMNEEIDLEQLGLTKIEAKVYIALLKTGSTTTGPLVKATELHRATVYDVLKRLMEKGLVNYITKEKTKYFEATKPEHLMDLLNQEKEELTKKEENTMHLIYKLNKIKELSKQKQNAHVFVGVKGVKTVMEDTMKYKEVLILGSSGRFKERMKSYFYHSLKRKRELRIKSRLIASESIRHTEIPKLLYGEKRFIPEQYESPISTMVFGDNVANFVWSETPVAFLIESKEAADSFRNYFEMLWEMAKK